MFKKSVDYVVLNLLKALNMKFQTLQFVIPAKAGTQEKVGKKNLSHTNREKTFLFQRPDWFPAFAGMTNWGSANA